jgi:hypothetical protein
MTQDKDFSLQSCPSSEAGWYGGKQGREKSKHGSGSYTLRMYNFNCFNKNGLFRRDRLNRPSICTRASERVYITAVGCDIKTLSLILD